MFDDEVWDEDRWESFLRKDDERVTRYMKTLNLFMEEHPMPSSEDERARQQWTEAFRAFLVKQGWLRDEIEMSGFFLDEDEIEHDEQEGFDLDMQDADEDVYEAEDTFERLEQLPYIAQPSN